MQRFLVVLLLASSAFAADPAAEQGARKAMDSFMTTFNSRDVNAWAVSLNFPHVRFASNTVRVFPNQADFIRDSKDYAARLGAWDHSSWQEMKVVQSGPDKVHFSVVFCPL